MDTPNPQPDKEIKFNVPPQDQQPQPQSHKSWFARHLLAEILGIVLAGAVLAGGYWYYATYLNQNSETKTPIHVPKSPTPTTPDSAVLVNSYESCINAGYPMSKSNPPKCTTADGTTYVKQTGACIQVITTARNPENGEIRQFPTPCDVPDGWDKQ